MPLLKTCLCTKVFLVAKSLKTPRSISCKIIPIFVFKGHVHNMAVKTCSFFYVKNIYRPRGPLSLAAKLWRLFFLLLESENCYN